MRKPSSTISHFFRCSIFLFVTSFLIFHFAKPAQAADDCSCPADQDQNSAACLQSKTTCLQGKIDQKQQAANTLNNTISILNGQVLISEIQVKQTKLEIDQLNKDIADLGNRISGLNLSLNQLTDVLIRRVQANYMAHQADPFDMLLTSDSVNSFFRREKYLQVAQHHTTEIMKLAEGQRISYDQQKTLKEQKQAEVDKKKQMLQVQETALTQQRTNEQTLLQQTRNDEARYQQLLAQAQAELSSFQSFATDIGIGVLPPQNSPDGWYFSQRDQRWANACIGNSCGTRNSATILDVGCLISSISMIMKKFGQDVTPLSVARTASYFFSDTAYMMQPWPAPPGYSYIHTNFSEDKVDSELSSGRPVIVHLRINSRDGHFIVLKSGSRGNYVMHDPAEGYDKNFTDYYHTWQINSLAYLRKT